VIERPLLRVPQVSTNSFEFTSPLRRRAAIERTDDGENSGISEVDALLDVSRITQGKIRLRRRPIDAVPILHHAAESVRPLVDSRGHRLDLSVATPELWTNADPIRLQQILVNLLTNAAKYTPQGGKIEMIAYPEGDEIVFRVRDNGVGIAHDSLAGMFELFAQSDRSLARSEGGLGIGLTLVKSLAELHGGTISAASGGIGLGSEFSLRLPSVRRPEGDKIDARAATGTSPGKARRILVIDDNADSARSMARLLQLDGHVLDLAYDGPTAIESARAFRPEAMVLDIGLPGLDGYEVARQIRQEEWGRDVLIVAVSGYGQDDDRNRARESGIDHHLTKTVEFDALAQLLSGSHSA
jgi:CheY-like chemotaxis protein